MEQLEAKRLLAGDVAHNFENAYDVNNDGYVSPLDAAVLIWNLSTSGARAAAATGGGEGEPPLGPQPEPSLFFDVTNDGLINSQDVSALIDTLNHAAGEPGDVVTFRLETTDVAGNPISSITAGEEFVLHVFTADTQDTAARDEFGVFAAYLDIQYDASLASVTGAIQYADSFDSGQLGSTDVAGIIDEAGAFRSSFTPSGRGEFEVFSLRMRADSPGTLNLTSNPSDNLPTTGVGVYSSDDLVANEDILFGSTSLQITGAQQEAPDLVAFAKALADAGVVVWTATINARGRIADQLSLFEEGEHFLPIRELQEQAPLDEGGGLRFTQEATDAGRTRANVWVFPDGSESNGELLSLETISQRSGVAIPTGAVPSLVPIEDVTVLAGSPLHIPLDGYDPNGDELTFTITVENDNLLSTFMPEGNRSLRLTTSDLQSDFGEMVFQLFEGRAPRATEQIISLTEDGFYDGISFHRVVDRFVIQTGDPTGTGGGGSPLDDFDDQFHLDLQHNRVGVLSMAKSLDDTNDSQFFINERPTRFLDFNHTIFGQLIEGDRVRETISNVDVRDGGNGEASIPVLTVNLDDAEIFEDHENAVVMLRGLASTGSTNVTVTVSDAAGNSSSETFAVTLADDDENGQPFLEDIEDQVFSSGEDYRFDVTALDAEGDDVSFAAVSSNPEVTATVVDNGNEATIVLSADADFAGAFTVTVTATPTDLSPFPAQLDPQDNQRVAVNIAPLGPTSVDLLASSDTGLSATDNVTNRTELEFTVGGVRDGARVLLLANGVEVGEGTASGDTITITTANPSALGSGERVITAVQEVDGNRSLESPPITILLDQVEPAAVMGSAPAEASVGVRYTFDASHPEEGSSGFRYSLNSAPSGMQIDSLTGLIEWTPTNSQRGPQPYEIVVTDLAGNATTTSFTASVIGEVALIQLIAADLDGDPTGGLATGEDFLLQVFVDDQRSNATGISEVSFDLTFNDSLVEVTGPISFGSSFPDGRSGTVASGTISDLSASTTAALGPGPFLLATIPMRATTVGTAVFAGTVADGDVLFSGETNPLDGDEVGIQTATLSILSAGAELVANDDTLTVDEDSGEVQIPVLDNDQLGPNSVIVNVVSRTDPDMNGTATISTDRQSIFYTPAADFFGTETFTYVIRDSQGVEASASVTVTVNPVNDPPVANDDFFPADLPPYDPNVHGSTNPRLFFVEDGTTAIVLRPISNDDIAPDDFGPQEIITITSVGTAGTAGTVVINPDAGNFGLLYTPAPNFFGDDTFTYTITDNHGVPLSATGTITVSIAQKNDPPTAGDDAFHVPPDLPLTIQPAELFANDSAGPQEDATQSLQVVGVVGATKGSVVLNADGSVTYTPNPNATGVDTFTYTVRDNGQTDFFDDPDTRVARDDFLEATGTVTLNLNSGNVAPDAFDDRVSIVGNSAATTINVLGNDRDDGPLSNLQVTAVTNPDQGGTATLINGVVSYRPATSFVGTERFSYTVSDGDLTDTANVIITVTDPANSTNSRFAGSVFIDNNNDGQRDSREAGIGGVRLLLTGSDVDGNAVTREVTTDINGAYAFDALPKGTYTVTQSQPRFLLDGQEVPDPLSSLSGDAFTLSVGDDLITSEGNLFAERGFSPQFAMLATLSSSRAAKGFMAATAAGESQIVNTPRGWEDYSHIDVALSSDGKQVTIRATDKDSVLHEAIFAAHNKSLVHLLGRDDDAFLLRIVGAANDYDLQPVASGASAAAVDAFFATA